MPRFSLITCAAVLIGTFSAGAATVRMETTLGNIDVELYGGIAPQSCGSFLGCVTRGAYDNSIFHRSEAGFVLEGGGFRPTEIGDGYDLSPIPAGDPVVNEFSPELSNVLGTLAMRSTADGSSPPSSQWFFNMGDNSSIFDGPNSGINVFGRVTAGLDVLLALGALEVFNFSGGDSSSPFVEFPTMDSYTQEAYEAGSYPALSDLVWLRSAWPITDANNDGMVDATDYIVLKRNFGAQSGAGWQQGDFDSDGDVDYDDLRLLTLCLSKPPVTSSSMTPEPASAMMLRKRPVKYT